MSFASKPFSAATSQQSVGSGQQRAMFRPAWPMQQRRRLLAYGRDQLDNASGSSRRLSGWPGGSPIQRQRQTQPEVTFEFWCSAAFRRQQTVGSRPVSPTEAALALIMLPVKDGFASSCSCSDAAARSSESDDVAPPDQVPASPEPNSASADDSQHEEEVANTEAANTEAALTSLTLPTAQQQHQQSPSSWRTVQPPQQLLSSRQQLQQPFNRPVSAGPTDQLLRLVRLSYTHSDLTTRRLLKSSLLHRTRPAADSNPPAAQASLRSVAESSGGSVGGGLLTRQRFPMPTPIVLRKSGEQPPLRLWIRAECLSLPPLVPN